MYKTYTPNNPVFTDNYDPESLVKIPSRNNRLSFLRNVYLVIIYQLVITIAMCAAAMYNNSIRNYVLTNTGPLITGVVFSFVFMFMLFCYQKSYPANMCILTAFTICISYTVAVTCASYVTSGYENLVIKSFLITILVFISLTLYTLQSKHDFSFLQEIVFGGIMILLLWGFVSWATGTDSGIGYSILGIFVFVCAIIFDTHRLKEQFDDDEYIIAAITLYLDIINLFMYILDFLKKFNK